MHKTRLLCLAILAAASAAAPAAAAEIGNGLSITGGATIVSDYRFRGVSLSDEDPAVQGSVGFSHESGFYGGLWGSSLDDTPVYGHTELNLYGGWSGEIASGTGLDVGATYYFYPNGDSAFGNSDFLEPYVKLSHAIGPVEATVGAAYAFSQSAIGDDDNIYVFTDLSAAIPNTPLTLKGHVGYSDGSLAPTGSYWDWLIGIDAAVGPATIGIAYVDTDLGNARAVDAGVVFSLGISF